MARLSRAIAHITRYTKKNHFAFQFVSIVRNNYVQCDQRYHRFVWTEIVSISRYHSIVSFLHLTVFATTLWHYLDSAAGHAVAVMRSTHSTTDNRTQEVSQPAPLMMNLVLSTAKDTRSYIHCVRNDREGYENREGRPLQCFPLQQTSPRTYAKCTIIRQNSRRNTLKTLTSWGISDV